MSLALAEPVLAARPPSAPPTPTPRDALLRAAIQTARDRVAPLWPLSSFVAVNPFLGFATTPFDQAARAKFDASEAAADALLDFLSARRPSGRLNGPIQGA